MNAVITNAVKARKLITDIHGPQFKRLNGVIAEADVPRLPTGPQAYVLLI